MARNINLFADLRTICQLVKLFKKEKPTIVHTHTPKAGLLGMIAAKIARVPIRMHTVTGFPLTIAQGLKKVILTITEKTTYACATNVYPNSHNMKDIIVSMGIGNPHKLTVIGNGSSNGIDTSFFDKAKIDKVPCIKKGFTFAFVGRIFYEKGINELISSFVKLQKTHKSIYLRLIGFMEEDLYPVDPWIKDEINNNPSIDFVGFQKDVRKFLVDCDAFVFPSYREGFPNVVMQAGALGLPQIVSDINGCNEIIENGKNGIIVPSKDADALYDAMKYILENSVELTSMRSCARDMITSRYERKKVWMLMLDEYNRLLSLHTDKS